MYFYFMQVTRPWKVRGGYLNRTIHIMVTPRVVQEVRTHFGCPNLEGAELEDQVHISIILVLFMNG